jgi:hypothetical protein
MTNLEFKIKKLEKENNTKFPILFEKDKKFNLKYKNKEFKEKANIIYEKYNYKV